MATENSDDIRLIVKIAQLYYEQDMTQAWTRAGYRHHRH